MTSNSGINAKKIEVYVPSAVALVVGIVVLILAAILYSQSADQGKASQVIKTISQSNGFSGQIRDQTLTLKTSSLGILSYPGLTTASATSITSQPLTSFNNNNPGSTITVSDSIKSGLEKILLLNYTPLTGFVPSAGSLSDVDTIFLAVNKLAGSIQNQTNPFSVYTVVTTNSQTAVPMWVRNMKGSLTLKPNFISSGSVLQIECFGNIAGPETSQTATFNFTIDGTILFSIDTVPTSVAPAQRGIRLIITLSFNATTVNFVAYTSMYNHPSGTLIGLETFISGTTNFNQGVSHLLGLTASTSSALMSVTLTNSVCSTIAGN
jgi:hypothetical protein